jgi:hypothetical protein
MAGEREAGKEVRWYHGFGSKLRDPSGLMT